MLVDCWRRRYAGGARTRIANVHRGAAGSSVALSLTVSCGASGAAWATGSRWQASRHSNAWIVGVATRYLGGSSPFLVWSKT
jgi:hypothetical protein